MYTQGKLWVFEEKKSIFGFYALPTQIESSKNYHKSHHFYLRSNIIHSWNNSNERFLWMNYSDGIHSQHSNVIIVIYAGRCVSHANGSASLIQRMWFCGQKSYYFNTFNIFSNKLIHAVACVGFANPSVMLTLTIVLVLCLIISFSSNNVE